MDTSAIDFPALALAVAAAALITGAVAFAQRSERTSTVWLAGAAVALFLIAAGLADLLRERPRETHLATLFLGIPLPVLGAIGMQWATRRVRPLYRWPAVFIATLLLLLSGLLIGAAILPRYLS